jgi:hypothetical protein
MMTTLSRYCEVIKSKMKFMDCGLFIITDISCYRAKCYRSEQNSYEILEFHSSIVESSVQSVETTRADDEVPWNTCQQYFRPKWGFLLYLYLAKQKIRCFSKKRQKNSKIFSRNFCLNYCYRFLNGVFSYRNLKHIALQASGNRETPKIDSSGDLQRNNSQKNIFPTRVQDPILQIFVSGKSKQRSWELSLVECCEHTFSPDMY